MCLVVWNAKERRCHVHPNHMFGDWTRNNQNQDPLRNRRLSVNTGTTQPSSCPHRTILSMYQTLYALDFPDLFSYMTMVGKMNGKYVLLDLGPKKPWYSCPSSYAAVLSFTPKSRPCENQW